MSPTGDRRPRRLRAYPPSLRDLLLTLAALDAFEVRWSDEVLDEVARNVVADHPDLDATRFVEHTIGAMRRAVPEALGRASAELIQTLDNDPKDRHVAALALAVSADAIVTLNIADFDSRILREADVKILTPGTLVTRLLHETPEVVLQAVGHMADRWSNPPRTPDEIVQLLAAHPTMREAMSLLRERLGE